MKTFTKLIIILVLLFLAVSEIIAQKAILQSDTGRSGNITCQSYDIAKHYLFDRMVFML